MLTHVSLMRDPRATQNMVLDEVWANLPPDPEVVRLQERRAQLKAGRYRVKGHEDEEEIRNIGERIRNGREKWEACAAQRGDMISYGHPKYKETKVQLEDVNHYRNLPEQHSRKDLRPRRGIRRRNLLTKDPTFLNGLL